MAQRPQHLPEDTAIYEDEDGVLWGLDDRGEFKLDPPQGNPAPQDGLCSAELVLSQQRYGETRYCGRTPYWPSSDSDKEPSDFCRQHRSREALMERAIELVKHGAFGRNYVVFEKSLDATEFLFAIDMFAGLMEMSQYEYEVHIEERTIDATDDDLIEEDEIVVQLPLPKASKFQTQANELWYVALDEIVEQRMQNIRLMQGVSTSHVVATADDEGTITDRIEEGAEHHLNLPISRLSKDKKDRLAIGGVEVGADDDGGAMVFSTGEYVLDIGDEAPEMEEPMTAMLEDEDE